MKRLWSCAVLLLVGCSGGGGDARSFSFGAETVRVRVGEPVALSAGGGVGEAFMVTPPLPAGLAVDPSTGDVAGTPSEVAAAADYVVRGTLGGGVVEARLRLAVGAALPAEIAHAEAGFEVVQVASLVQAPGKFAVAPDGRVFVTELQTGVVRIVATDGTLEPTPFATVPVVNGSHRGLLSVALSPEFESDGRVFALACVPAGGGKPERSVLYRWTEVAGVGTAQTVLLDDLPVSTINNGGALCFDGRGMLLVSVGDTEDPALAQDGASLAGKVLRVDPEDGSAPADNPTVGSLVFASGFRNVFAIAREPEVGAVFVADNGPTDNDELNLLLAGRNYEWGAGGAAFGAQTGPLLRLWPDVVVPTGIAFRDAADGLDWPEAFERSLYLGLYEEEVVERFEMSGDLRADIDRETGFVRFAPSGTDNKPLDLQRGPEGRIWILTFAAIYRVDRIR